MNEETDVAQDASQMEPVIQVLEILITKVEQIEDRLQKLECVVMDDLIGGVESLYKGNLRTKGIKDIEGKYGHLFGPHMSVIKELEPDTDVYGTLYDMLESAKGGDADWNDEKEMASMTDYAGKIGEKIGKLRGAFVPPEAKPEEAPAAEGGEPEGGSVEVTKVEASGDGPDEKVMEKFRNMAAANKARGAKSAF